MYSRPACEVRSYSAPAVRAAAHFAFQILALTPPAPQRDCSAPDFHFQPFVCLRLRLPLTTKEQNFLPEAAQYHSGIIDDYGAAGHTVF